MVCPSQTQKKEKEMKTRIRIWVAEYSYDPLYTAEYKSLFFWKKIGHFNDEPSARKGIEMYKKSRASEGIIVVD